MRLSVCLLARNDENTIGRAVTSVGYVADEVLVADASSNDATPRVAADAGASVTQFAWEDDFSAGRNYLVSRATGDWILWLISTEELAAASRDAVRNAMTNERAVGHFVRVRNMHDQAYTETADLRLFRRRNDLRFIGRLHPHLDPAVVEAVKREALGVAHCDVVLLHHGDHGPPTESKLRWNARLLELELRDRPGQLHYLIEQGRILLRLKDERGHASMAAAADQVHAARNEPKAPNAKVQVLLRYLLSNPQAKGPLTVDDARHLALRWFPDSPVLLWLLAAQRFAAGQFEGAADLLRRLIRLGQTDTFDRSQPFERDIVGERATLNLGACCLKLGRAAEAEACFLQLLTSPTLGAAADRQLQIVRRMKQQP